MVLQIGIQYLDSPDLGACALEAKTVTVRWIYKLIWKGFHTTNIQFQINNQTHSPKNVTLNFFLNKMPLGKII